MATPVLAASQHGLLLQKFDFMLGSVFQFFGANQTNKLWDNTHVRIYLVAFCIYIRQGKCLKCMCSVRNVTGIWYTVQAPGYFNLLPSSGRQSPRKGENKILENKYTLSVPQTYLQLLRQIKLSSVNIRFKVYNFC
jgi:hypothetical protein